MALTDSWEHSLEEWVGTESSIYGMKVRVLVGRSGSGSGARSMGKHQWYVMHDMAQQRCSRRNES